MLLLGFPARDCCLHIVAIPRPARSSRPYLPGVRKVEAATPKIHPSFHSNVFWNIGIAAAQIVPRESWQIKVDCEA